MLLSIVIKRLTKLSNRLMSFLGDQLYTKQNRLSDVFALIQLLALDERAHRSEDGLQQSLQGTPKSASSWQDIANAHPEFFRVSPTAEHSISLIARHAMPRTDTGREPLDPAFVHELLKTATSLHDAERRRRDRWKHLVPIAAAFVVGLLSAGFT